MHSIVDFLVSIDLTALATDPRILFAVGVVFVLAVIFRWKAVILLLCAGGGLVGVLRYSGLSQGEAEIGKNLYIFAGGLLVIGFVMIYFLFMRGD